MAKIRQVEPDSVFFLKLVIYLLLAVMWLQVNYNGHTVPIPFGFFVGIFLANHDHFAIDRKIEYAVMLIAMIASYVLPIGFVLLI